MRGIVAEINGKYAVVLTQTGSFDKVKATSDMAIGKEIDLNRLAGNNRMARIVMKVTSLAAAGLLVLGVGLGAYCYTLPYSYVHVDINPSIELTVNIYDRIIKAEALNEDGEELLRKNDLRNEKVDAGVALLLNSAVQQGYLYNAPAQTEDAPTRSAPSEPNTSGDKPETTTGESAASEPKAHEIANAVLVTISSNNKRKTDALQKELADIVSGELDKDLIKSDVFVARASIEQRNDARKYGVTPGKLVLIEDAMEGKPASDMDKLKKAAIKDLLDMAADKKDEKELTEEKQKDAKKDNEVREEKRELEIQRGKKAEEKAEVEREKEEAERKEAEAKRKEAEAERKEAEAERIKAEAERKKAEAERKKAEADRKKADKKELLEQINDKTKNWNWKGDGQGNWRNDNKASDGRHLDR